MAHRYRYALRWGDAGEAGMDHEQNFCPGNAFWDGKCTNDHVALDFSCYLIYEAQALAKIAAAIGRQDRATYVYSSFFKTLLFNYVVP